MMNQETTTEQAPVQSGEVKKKITLATFKSFVRKNADNLWAKTEMSFDGMVDCVTRVEDTWRRTTAENVLSNKSVWLVGSSRDYFSPYQNGVWVGIEISNCCGNWLIATNIE